MSVRLTANVKRALQRAMDGAWHPARPQWEGRSVELRIVAKQLAFLLHWEAFDADLSIPGLLAGLFGMKAYLAPQAGRATSPAKAAAARANGTKGGRPNRSVRS